MKLFQKSKLKGFTLIELMIVVAIIGILAAVAIPKFADLVTKSKEASTKGNLGSIRSAVSIYYGDQEGINPTNLFTGLTTANKYMPPVGGAQSLGKFILPKVTANSFQGHESGQHSNLDNVTGVKMGGIDDTTPLYYESSAGSIQINCSHKDTKNAIWSSY